MKTIYLTLFSLFILGSSIHAHNIFFNDSPIYHVHKNRVDSVAVQNTFFNDSLRQRLTRYLLDRQIANYNGIYIFPLIIRNLVNGEVMENNQDTVVDEYGIYDFHSTYQIMAYSFVLIKSGNEYEVLDLIRKDQSEIRAELAAYFDRHPEVPNDLLPVYANAVRRAKQKYDRLEKKSAYYIQKDELNDSVYHFIEKISGDTIVRQVLID